MHKSGNPHRISLRQWMDDEGYESLEDCEDILMDAVVPALCDEGCQVEPDGRCEHDCPSIPLALGII